MAKENEKMTKAEKAQAKADAKYAKREAKYEAAYEKKDSLQAQIDELKKDILNESDLKKKDKLRKKRDELVAERNSIVITPDELKVPMAKKKKNIITAVIAIVVVIALLCAYVGTGFVRKGLCANLGLPQSTVTAYTIKDGDGNKNHVKVSTYNYYFAMYYNNLQSTVSSYKSYGIDLEKANMNVDFDDKLSNQIRSEDGKDQTWLEYVQEQVMDSIKDTYMWYYEALKANDGKEPEITEEQQKEIDEAIDSYKKSAQGYGYEVSGYLQAAMGKGVTEEVFRKEAKISYIAENYKAEYDENASKKEYSEEEYEAYKKENLAKLQSVDVKIFECDGEDDAKAFAKALKADGSNFADLSSKYASSDWDKKANKNAVETTHKALTRGTLEGNSAYAIGTADEHEHEDGEEEEHKYSGLDWLYSKDRKAGDYKQFSTTVVYVVKPVYLSTQKTVNVRHILISPVVEDEDDEDSSSKQATDCTDKEWAEAKKKAEKILKEYKDGEKTAEAFGKLAKENTGDSNGEDGGLYENVTPNQMVPTFDAWCFDSARKAGDTAIVKTQYGYHIMYFEGYGDLPIWKYTAQQALASEDGTDAKEKLEKGYTIKKSWFGSRFFEIDTDIDN